MKASIKPLSSSALIIIFILLAMGSFAPPVTIVTDEYDDETGERVITRSDGSVQRGYVNGLDSWHGETTRTFQNGSKTTTEYHMGQRTGWTREYNPQGGLIREDYYQNGVITDPPDQRNANSPTFKINIRAVDTDGSLSIYQMLESRRPWLIYDMEKKGYSAGALQSFVTEIESRITPSSPDPSNFDTLFNNAVNEVGNLDQFKSIHQAYTEIADEESWEARKRSKLRMASFDRLINGASSTYSVMQTTYPEYLVRLQRDGATLEDVERVANELDTRIDAAGELDPKDPAFPVLMDKRYYDTLSAMYNDDDFDMGTVVVPLGLELQKLGNNSDPLRVSAKETYFPAFDDVPFGHWAHEYTLAIRGAGITTGCGGNNYCPQNRVLRDEMAAFLIRAIEGNPADDYCEGGAPFSDVNPQDWSCPHIKRLNQLAITGGCGGTRYCPRDPVTREQMAAFIVRSLVGEPPQNYCDDGSPFNDVPPQHPYCRYIKRLFELEVTTGCGDGSNYCPSPNVSREEMSAFLARAFLEMP